MISAWWVAWAFLGGGLAGVLLMALMSMARDQPDRSTYTPEAPPRRHGAVIA